MRKIFLVALGVGLLIGLLVGCAGTVNGFKRGQLEKVWRDALGQQAVKEQQAMAESVPANILGSQVVIAEITTTQDVKMGIVKYQVLNQKAVPIIDVYLILGRIGSEWQVVQMFVRSGEADRPPVQEDKKETL